jgi:mRNA interferase RelE/StbE
MIKYEDAVLKAFKKGLIPKSIFEHIHNAFQAIDLTKDLTLFDIKKLQGSDIREYYRLRKGKYRAIFYIQENDIFVIKISKREDVYK